MPSERERQALTAILDHVVLVRRLLRELDEAAFAADRQTFYAVTHCLEIVLEAAR